MMQAIIVALIGGILGGSAIAALINALANKRKIHAEVVSILAKTAGDLIVPLEKRLNDLQRDNEMRDEIIRRQSDSYDRLELKYDQMQYELRAVRADRDNLLAERIIYQKRVDAQAETITNLKTRVEELERELALIRNSKHGAT